MKKLLFLALFVFVALGAFALDAELTFGMAYDYMYSAFDTNLGLEINHNLTDTFQIYVKGSGDIMAWGILQPGLPAYDASVIVLGGEVGIRLRNALVIYWSGFSPIRSTFAPYSFGDALDYMLSHTGQRVGIKLVIKGSDVLK